jgi:hypothetical protein
MINEIIFIVVGVLLGALILLIARLTIFAILKYIELKNEEINDIVVRYNSTDNKLLHKTRNSKK